MVSDGNHTVRWQPSPGATCYALGASDDGAQTWTTTNTGALTYKEFTAVPHGTWTYRVRACDGMQYGAWSNTVTVTVGTGSVPAPPRPKTTSANAIISESARADSDKVGTLPGSFRVTEQGSAGYRIDLALPPGTAGVVPPLALGYDSRRGNGPLGVGWALEGLSGITRCRQTLAQDGAAQPLTFTDTDRFCLDGQRLVQSKEDRQNKVDYGAKGSTYQTETDSFLTVTAKDGAAGHPDYFEVQRKDGSVALYGAAGTSAAEHKLYANLTDQAPTGKVLTWALQEVKDSVGNKITYHYTLDAKGHRLTHIRYAYGASKTAYQAEVVLAYEDRKDPSTGYLAGYPVQSTQRLQRVSVRAAPSQGGLATLYNYRLRYRAVSTGTVDSLSRLVSVQGCVGAGESACRPKTTFAWSEPKAGFNASADITTTLADSDWQVVDTTPADINGDGRTDLVWTEIKDEQHRIRYALTNPANGTLANTAFTANANNLVYDETYGCEACDDQLKVHVTPVDINADGRQDLLVYSTKARQTRLHLSTPQAGGGWALDGTGTMLFSHRYRYADLNSDGLLDAYRLDELAPIRTGLKAVSGYRLLVRYLVVDTNADVSSNRYYTYSDEQAHPIDFITQAPDTTTPLRWRSLSMADTALADVDGDGRADLLLWGIDNEETFPNQGGSTVLSSLERLTVFRQSGTGSALRFAPYGPALDVSPASPAAPRAVRVRDINRDGLSDLIYFTGKRYTRNITNPRWTGDWHYRLSTGNGWTGATVLLDTPANARAPRTPSLHDDNSDGYPDVLWHDVKARQLKRKRYDPATGTFAAAATVRATKGEDEEQYLTLDMNGDGHGDLLQLYQKGKTKTLRQYYQPTPGRPHLITAITNGLGARTAVTYESLIRTDAYVRIEGISTTTVMKKVCPPRRITLCREAPVTVADATAFYTALNTPWADMTLTDSLAATSGGAPVLELMGPLYVVTQVQSSAPTGSDATAASAIGYLYEQGKLQAAGRGLLGFKALTTVDLQTGVATTTTYRQDFPYSGYPQTTEVRTKGNKLLRKAVNTWQLKGYQSGWNVAGPTAGLGALQPYLAEAVETTYDLPTTKTVNNQTTTTAGAKLSTVTTTNTYDDWGNPTGITVTTADHANGLVFKQATSNSYGPTNTGPTPTYEQQYGRLTKTTVTRQRDLNGDKDYADRNEALIRTSTFSYHTTGKTRGLLRTETLAPGNTRLEHETTYHYDTFGHRVRAVVKAAGDKSGRRTETRCNVDTVKYDTSGRYVIKAWDCLGRERRTLSGHNGWGQPATVARVVNASPRRVVSTTHTYTPGGGPAVSRESAGGYTGQRKARCTGSVAHCPSGAVYYIERKQAGGGRQWDYRDKLDRVVRTRTAGFADKTWVLTDTEYDNLGRVARQSEPYYAGKTRHWTSYRYDLLGRVVKTTLPDYETDANDAVTVNSVITTAYTGFTATTTNGKGQRTTETRNALGEVIKSTDAAGTPVAHTHDAWGQVIKTTTGTGTKAVSVAWEYDARGRRTAVADPHWPAWRATRYQYTWNDFDELIEQADRLGNRLEMTYDGLGRLTTRTDTQPGDRADEVVVATWRYDTAANGLGRPGRVAQRVGLVTEQDSYRRTHAYDRYGRASDTALTVQVQGGTQTYHTRQTWDEYGRPHQHFDARPAARFTDHVTEVHYNERGYAHRWTDGVYVKGEPRHTYRELTALDARGNVTKETLGGGVVRTGRTHDVKTGRIEGITTKDALLRTAQADTYGWDVLGNLTARTGVVGNDTLTESFTYDTRNRLTKAGAVLKQDDPVTNATTTRTLTPQAVSYDALGNITRKSGVGTYTYGAEHPYAVTATRGEDNRTTTYVYDVQGNQVSGAGRTLEYTAFNKLKGIDKGMRRTTFTYGPDRARSTRTDTARTGNGRSTTTTVYLGNVEHVIAEDGSSTFKRTLAGGSVLITRDYDKLNKQTGEDTRYLLRDHLGSLTTILNKHGLLLQSFGYDAWGARRAPGTAAVLDSLTLSSPVHTRTTPRGYTGHEMLDAHGIIHMNGRIYDPRLGRFLQADPIVQFPHYSQGQNTYSYVLNNPLTYTDPSGHFIPVFAAIAAGISIGLKVKLVTAAILIGAGVFADSLAQGAPLDKAFLAGVSAGALTAVAVGTLPGSYGLNLATFKHVATVATVGGITASLQGGKFGHGFLSAGIGAAAGGIPLLGKTAAARIAARTVVSAVTAGTVSEITGGKFANGAMTAAFFSLVSSAAQRAVSMRQDFNETALPRDIDGQQGQSEFERFNEFVRNQGTEREWFEDVKVERIADSLDKLPSSVRNFEPGDALGNFMDDRGLHLWNQRLSGGYHLTVDRPGGPVNLHFDAFDPLRGIGSTLGHGLLEVAPIMLRTTDVLAPIDVYPDWGR